MRRHPYGHKETARGPAVATGLAAALEPDALRVTDAGRHSHLDLTGTAARARTPAVGTGVGDDAAPSGASAAGLAEREEALIVVGDAAAVARRARLRDRARSGTTAFAGLTRGVAGEMHGGGHAVDGVDERQVQFGFEISTSCGAGAARSARPPAALIPAATEELSEEPGEITTIFEAIAAAARLTEPARHRAEPAHLVVLLALGLVAEH